MNTNKRTDDYKQYNNCYYRINTRANHWTILQNKQTAIYLRNKINCALWRRALRGPKVLLKYKEVLSKDRKASLEGDIEF